MFLVAAFLMKVQEVLGPDQQITPEETHQSNGQVVEESKSTIGKNENGLSETHHSSSEEEFIDVELGSNSIRNSDLESREFESVSSSPRTDSEHISTSSHYSDSDTQSISSINSDSDTASILTISSNHSNPGETNDYELPICPDEVDDLHSNSCNGKEQTDLISSCSSLSRRNSAPEGCSIYCSELLQSDVTNGYDGKGGFDSLERELLKTTDDIEEITIKYEYQTSNEDSYEFTQETNNINEHYNFVKYLSHSLSSDTSDSSDGSLNEILNITGDFHQFNEEVISADKMTSLATANVEQQNNNNLADNIRDYEKGILQSKIFSDIKSRKVQFMPCPITIDDIINDDDILQANLEIYNDGLNEFFIVEDPTNDDFILQQNLKCYLNGLEKLELPYSLYCNNDESKPNDTASLINNKEISRDKSIAKCEIEVDVDNKKEYEKLLVLQENIRTYDIAIQQCQDKISLNQDSLHINTSVNFINNTADEMTSLASHSVQQQNNDQLTENIRDYENGILQSKIFSDVKLTNKIIENEAELNNTADESLYNTGREYISNIPTRKQTSIILQQNIHDYDAQINLWFDSNKSINTCESHAKNKFHETERMNFALKTVDEVVAEAKLICDRIFMEQNKENKNRIREDQQLTQVCDQNKELVLIDSVGSIYSENITDGLDHQTLTSKNDPFPHDCITRISSDIIKGLETCDKNKHKNSVISEDLTKNNSIFESDLTIANVTFPLEKENISVNIPNKCSDISVEILPAKLEKRKSTEDDIFKVLEMTNEKEYKEDLCSPKSSPKLMRLIQTLALGGYYEDDSDLSDEENIADHFGKTSTIDDRLKVNKINCTSKSIDIFDLNSIPQPTEISPYVKNDSDIKNELQFTNHLQQNTREYENEINEWLYGNKNSTINNNGIPLSEEKLSDAKRKYVATKTADEVVAEAKLICDRILLEYNIESCNENVKEKKETKCNDNTDTNDNKQDDDDDIFKVLERTDFNEDLCSPKSSPKLMRLIQSLSLGIDFDSELSISDEDNNENDRENDTYTVDVLSSKKVQKFEENNANLYTDKTDQVILEKKPATDAIFSNQKLDSAERNTSNHFNSYPHPPPRKKKSMSVSCLQSEMLNEDLSELEDNKIKFTNKFFENNKIIVPPPRKNRKNRSPMSYSMSDVSVVDLDTDFLAGKKYTESKGHTTDNIDDGDNLHYATHQKDSKHEIHFAAPEVSASIVDYNVFNPRRQSQRASIALIDDVAFEDRAATLFQPKKTPHVKKKSYTFTSSDIYAKEAREKVNLKRSKSSVSKMIKKTFSLKKLNKNHDPPCMPNLVKRYMRVRKNKRNKKRKAMESIPEEPFPKLTKTESFASIFMGSSSEDLEFEDLESYDSNNFLNFSEDESRNIQRSVSHVELVTDSKTGSKTNRLKRSSSFIQITANPKSFVKRLATEDSTVSLNPEAIKRAHELLNKSIELGKSENNIKTSTGSQGSISDLVIEKESDSGKLKSDSNDKSDDAKSGIANVALAIMSKKFIKSSLASLSRLSSPILTTSNTKSLINSSHKKVYNEKQFSAPLSLLKFKKENGEIPTSTKSTEAVNVIHQCSKTDKEVVHSFKVAPSSLSSLNKATMTMDTEQDSNVVHSFPFVSEKRMNKKIEKIENVRIMNFSYENEASNEVNMDAEECKISSADSILSNSDNITNEINSKYHSFDQIDSNLPQNGSINFHQHENDNEILCPLEVLKDINNKIQCIHDRMQKNSEELNLATKKQESLVSSHVYLNSNNIEDCNNGLELIDKKESRIKDENIYDAKRTSSEEDDFCECSSVESLSDTEETVSKEKNSSLHHMTYNSTVTSKDTGFHENYSNKLSSLNESNDSECTKTTDIDHFSDNTCKDDENTNKSSTTVYKFTSKQMEHVNDFPIFESYKKNNLYQPSLNIYPVLCSQTINFESVNSIEIYPNNCKDIEENAFGHELIPASVNKLICDEESSEIITQVSEDFFKDAEDTNKAYATFNNVISMQMGNVNDFPIFENYKKYNLYRPSLNIYPVLLCQTNNFGSDNPLEISARNTDCEEETLSNYSLSSLLNEVIDNEESLEIPPEFSEKICNDTENIDKSCPSFHNFTNEQKLNISEFPIFENINKANLYQPSINIYPLLSNKTNNFERNALMEAIPINDKNMKDVELSSQSLSPLINEESRNEQSSLIITEDYEYNLRNEQYINKPDPNNYNFTNEHELHINDNAIFSKCNKGSLYQPSLNIYPVLMSQTVELKNINSVETYQTTFKDEKNDTDSPKSLSAVVTKLNEEQSSQIITQVSENIFKNNVDENNSDTSLPTFTTEQKFHIEDFPNYIKSEKSNSFQPNLNIYPQVSARTINSESNAEESSETQQIIFEKSGFLENDENLLNSNGQISLAVECGTKNLNKYNGDIRRSKSLNVAPILDRSYSNKTTIRLRSPDTDRKVKITDSDKTEEAKLFTTTKEYKINLEKGVESQYDSVSMDGTSSNLNELAAGEFPCLIPAKSLPEIILRTWAERQDSLETKVNERNSCKSGIPVQAVLQVTPETDETKSSSDKKEEYRIQKDRCVEVYPETIRQRQRNMAPSPNKVDIKNWEVTDETDAVKDKKLLPSVKALRNQFENGGREETQSPTGNSLAGRSSSSSSTSSLSLTSLEVASSHVSLNSGHSVNEPTELVELDGPIDPIYRQFRNVDQDIMSKPPSTIGWNPKLLLNKLYYLPQAPMISNKESAFIDIEGYLDKLPCGRKKSTFWNAWKRRYFCAKKGVLYCYHNNQMDKLSMKLPLLGGKVEIMDPSVVSVEDGKNDANSSGMLGIDDGKGHYVVVRCASRPEAERWKAALESHVIDDFASQYVQPWPRPSNPAMLRDTIVIDIGSCSVRAGVLASQATLPQLFFPSVVATNRETQRQIWGTEALLPDVRSLSNVSFPIKPSHKISKFSVDLNAVSSLLQKTFTDLNVDPKHYNIQLSVPRVLNPTTQTELMKILFDKFGVKGVNLTHQSILALYAYNATSGIVVDIGERIDVVPVIDGYIVDGGVSRVPYGGFRILEHLKHYLFQKNLSLLNEAESYIIRAVLEMVCYCAQHYNTEKARCTKTPDNFEKHAPLSDFFPNTTQFEAFHDISLNFGRFQATEGIFNPEAWGLDHPGLHKLVHKAIQECSMDIRKEMSKSIFLAGGVSQLPGLSDRLRTELDNLTPPAVRPKVHSSPYRYHASYLGACVLAESDAFSQSKISRDQWQKHGNSSLRKWAL